MPRGAPPMWKQKAPHTIEMWNHIPASVNAAPMDETGAYGELLVAGITTMERAVTVKRGLFNAAKHQGYSMSAEIESLTDGKFRVRFKVIDKKRARAYLIATKGKDRSQWAYDPRKRDK
jgi:hypothetical protein